jgi:hypothetical protein
MRGGEKCSTLVTPTPYIWSHTALDIFSLEGQVSDIKFKGEPSNISPMAEYAWYEWVKFGDTSVNFPGSKIQHGRDLGAAIDICPAMEQTVLNVNGKLMYRTSVRSLTSDEMQSPSETQAHLAFDEAVEKKPGSSMTKDDFKDDPDLADFETPTFSLMRTNKFLLPRCWMMLTLMTNMLALK